MNLSQIIREVNKDIDDSLDNEDVIGWINRALDDLTPVARKEAKQFYDLAEPITLPDDLYRVVMVLAGDCELYEVPIRDKNSKGYALWGNELTLRNAPSDGELELYYHKRLKHLAVADDTPEIDPAFHDLLILYAVAMYQYADEEPERQSDAMNRYYQRKREYEAYVLSRSNAEYQIKIANPLI